MTSSKSGIRQDDCDLEQGRTKEGTIRRALAGRFASPSTHYQGVKIDY